MLDQLELIGPGNGGFAFYVGSDGEVMRNPSAEPVLQGIEAGNPELQSTLTAMRVSAVSRTCSGYIALTVAAVPTGMKAGVRTSPRRKWSLPVRAAPQFLVMENLNSWRSWVRDSLHESRSAAHEVRVEAAVPALHRHN